MRGGFRAESNASSIPSSKFRNGFVSFRRVFCMHITRISTALSQGGLASTVVFWYQFRLPPVMCRDIEHVIVPQEEEIMSSPHPIRFRVIRFFFLPPVKELWGRRGRERILMYLQSVLGSLRTGPFPSGCSMNCLLGVPVV